MRDVRVRLAISQDDVANLAGINVSNYGKIERGLSNPTFHTLIRIAAVLGIDPGDLVRGLDASTLPTKGVTYTAKDFIRERQQQSRD